MSVDTSPKRLSAHRSSGVERTELVKPEYHASFKPSEQSGAVLSSRPGLARGGEKPQKVLCLGSKRQKQEKDLPRKMLSSWIRVDQIEESKEVISR